MPTDADPGAFDMRRACAPGSRKGKKSGASRARTDDLLAASQTLSQLSYSPELGNASLAMRL